MIYLNPKKLIKKAFFALILASVGLVFFESLKSPILETVSKIESTFGVSSVEQVDEELLLK